MRPQFDSPPNSGEFFFDKLLQLISDGKIALSRAPPAPPFHRKVDDNPDPTMEFAAWLYRIPSMSRKDILEECLKLLDEHWTKVTQNTKGKQLMQVVEDAIIQDLCQIQLLPVIMDNYRRFVLITEDRNDNNLERDGVSDSSFLDVFRMADLYSYRSSSLQRRTSHSEMISSLRTGGRTIMWSA